MFSDSVLRRHGAVVTEEDDSRHSEGAFITPTFNGGAWLVDIYIIPIEENLATVPFPVLRWGGRGRLFLKMAATIARTYAMGDKRSHYGTNLYLASQK